LGPLAGLRGIRLTVSVHLPSSSKQRGEYRRLPLSVTLALSVSPQTKNPNEALVAATPAVVEATNPTAAQQAKETAQGGQSKGGDGVVCGSMADAGPRVSPRMEDGNERYFSLLDAHTTE